MDSQGSHQPLPSVSEPTTPTEEDLAKASAWDDGDSSTLVSAKWKGKGKQRDDDGDDDDGTINGDGPRNEAGEYPPVANEELESRKIEQNLKRWETLEKQRRKKARDSRASKPDSPSSSSFSVSDVSRRASQLWSGRAKSRAEREAETRPHARTSGHQVLEDVDELPMEERGPPSASSPADTPRPSTTDNPFDDPDNTERPHAEQSQPDTLMTAAGPGSLPTTPKAVPEKRAPERPILQVQRASYIKPPPPKPLDLPDPTTEAERTQEQRAQLGEDEGVTEKKWWTEWLCGCREGGDDQAGRTNPME